MNILFVARRWRLMDIGMLQLGAVAAGHRWVVVSVPLAYLVAPLVALARLLGRRWFVIVSDVFPGDRALAAMFGSDSARMFWNYVSEFPPRRVAAPARRLVFFDPPGPGYHRFVFGPQPVAAAAQNGTFEFGVSYVGDVSLNFDLPRGRVWWDARLDALYTQHGASFLRDPAFYALLDEATTGAAERLAAQLLAKNYARLRLVKAAKAALGDRMTVFGSNWATHGIECRPSNYSFAFRQSLFARSKVNLDCGSKSGDNALYPRSAEIVTFGGGLLQSAGADSEAVYGERMREFCFSTEDELIALLRTRLDEPADARAARDAWLQDRLRRTGQLMSQSIDRAVSTT